MHRLNISFSILLCIFLSSSGLSAQVDSISVKSLTRLSFYSYEKNGEMLVHLPSSLIRKQLYALLVSGNDTLAEWTGTAVNKLARVPFVINREAGVREILTTITVKGGREEKYITRTTLTVLRYKSNEVKTDRLTGGLVVNKLPFFPFGFYTYSPVNPSLPADEVIKGFNLMSPYQKILPETLHERKSYMDRCAQLGMKVHYNLLSVSGGGGVGSKIEGIDSREKRERMIKEIEMFRDHPALLGWYIADEPNGYRIPPEVIEEIYRVIRENDPWHPVSVVFMAPFVSAEQYADALDIVMADPYPVPDLPVSMVGNVAKQLREKFSGRRPVWIVPQAFGGGELWSREPTPQELRSMTWQSIVNGATGIQYFVRQGPNYFPKSPSAWAECGRIAMEVAELTPWLLSDEEAKPVETSSSKTAVTSRMHDGKLAVIVVNKVNEPVSTTIRVPGLNSSKVRSLFENRILSVSGGTFSDYLPPYGSHVYLVNMKNNEGASSVKNLLADPGFEDLSFPGLPSACYARPGGDMGATYFLDSREHFEGDHSLRLVTPEKDKSVAIRFFPVRVKAGATYVISMMAKADPEQRFSINPPEPGMNNITIAEPQYVEVSFGEFSRSYFVPGKEWKQYVTFVTIPADTTSGFRTNLILKMPGQGVAWFDQIKIIEENPGNQ